VITRAAVSAAPAMQRKAIGLAFITVAILTVLAIRTLAVLRRVLLRRRWLGPLAAGDE
jgi:hypothetical protein